MTQVRKVGNHWFEFNPTKLEATPLSVLDALDQCPKPNDSTPSIVLFALGELPLQHHIDRDQSARRGVQIVPPAL